jgi:hypothetical protein
LGQLWVVAGAGYRAMDVLVFPVTVRLAVLYDDPAQAVNVLVPLSTWNTIWPAALTAVFGPNEPALPACWTVAAAVSDAVGSLMFTAALESRC